MNFFEQLFGLSETLDMDIKIMRKNEKFTISVLPNGSNDVQPAIITGTPAELDEGFIAAITAKVQSAGLLVQESDEVAPPASPKPVKAEDKKESERKKAALDKKSAKKDPPKEEKPEEPKEDKPSELSIF